MDLADRMLSVCPLRNRTKKWTIQVISHLFNLCVVNAWPQYRVVEAEKGTSKKYSTNERVQIKIETKLIIDNEGESDDEKEVMYENLEPKHNKRKVLIKPVQCKESRRINAAHLPEYGTNAVVEKNHSTMYKISNLFMFYS